MYVTNNDTYKIEGGKGDNVEHLVVTCNFINMNIMEIRQEREPKN